MYDGTITMSDPNLVDSFELDEQTTAYILRDTGAEAPDWDGIGAVYRLDYSHSFYDDQPLSESGCASPGVDVLRAAWDRFRDHELVARYLRAFWDVVDVDYSTMILRDANVYAIVTREMVTAWGVEEPAGLAAQALDVFRQWADGDVYGVVVVNTITGDEESLWGVYGTPEELRATAEEIAPIGVAS